MAVVEFENPVSGAVFVRFAGPLVPVWLVGAVLVLFLDGSAPGSAPLATPALGLLLIVYSLLVAGLVSVLYFREARRSPARVTLGVEGVTGQFRGPAIRDRQFDYARIVRVEAPGYFPARVEARSEGGLTVDWMNLTAENALRLREAWTAWKERVDGSPAPTA